MINKLQVTIAGHTCFHDTPGQNSSTSCLAAVSICIVTPTQLHFFQLLISVYFYVFLYNRNYYICLAIKFLLYFSNFRILVLGYIFIVSSKRQSQSTVTGYLSFHFHLINDMPLLNKEVKRVE